MGKYEQPRNVPNLTSELSEENDIELIAPSDSDPDQGLRDKKKLIILISISAAVLTLLIGLIIGIIALSGKSKDDHLILDNVFAGDTNLGGMTVEEATGVLHLATDRTFSRKPMEIRLSDGTVLSLSPADTGATLDVDAVVRAAYQHGRTGSDAEYLRMKKNAANTSYTIPLLPYLRLDLQYIRQTIDEFCQTNRSVLTESKVELRGVRPVYDPENPDTIVKHQTLHITMGTPEFTLDADDLYDKVLDAYSMNTLVLEYQSPEAILPAQITAADLFAEYCIAAKDAVLDTVTYEVTPEVYGYGFDTDALQAMIDGSHYGEEIEISLTFLIPGVLAENLAENMFLDTLGEFTSISDLNEENRNENLKLSCDAINGYVIKAGDTFSFKKAIGELSVINGYAEAAVSEFNRDAMGGGISQTASALYYCVLSANLDIIERHNHEFAVDFTELGLDAFVDGESKDLRFRNNSNSPVRIVASADENTVTVELHGINVLGYVTKLTPQIINKTEPETIYQIMTADNVHGYEDGHILQKGVPGYEVSVYMEKHDAISGDLLSSLQVSSSKYAKTDNTVVRIGYAADNDTTPPTEDYDSDADGL